MSQLKTKRYGTTLWLFFFLDIYLAIQTSEGCATALPMAKKIYFEVVFYKKLKNVSCEYDRVNGWNSTLQAAWYIRHLHKLSFARVLCFILMKDIGRWLPWMLPVRIVLYIVPGIRHTYNFCVSFSYIVPGHILSYWYIFAEQQNAATTWWRIVLATISGVR